MDAAGVGALIGIGGLISIFLCIRINDIWEKRKHKVVTQSTPLLVPIPPGTRVQLVRQHSKVSMILPKNSITR